MLNFVLLHVHMSHFRVHKKTSHKRRPTESSGGLWILIHSTDGPFTCRNLWKRFLNPSKAFLDTWKTHGLYLYLYSFHKKKRWGWHLQCDSYTKCQCHTLILPNKRQKGEHFSKYSAVQGKLLGLRWGFSCCLVSLKSKILCTYEKVKRHRSELREM